MQTIGVAGRQTCRRLLSVFTDFFPTCKPGGNLLAWLATTRARDAGIDRAGGRVGHHLREEKGAGGAQPGQSPSPLSGGRAPLRLLPLLAGRDEAARPLVVLGGRDVVHAEASSPEGGVLSRIRAPVPGTQLAGPGRCLTSTSSPARTRGASPAPRGHQRRSFFPKRAPPPPTWLTRWGSSVQHLIGTPPL